MKRQEPWQRRCCVCDELSEDKDQVLMCVIFNEPYHCKGCTPRPDQTRLRPEGDGPVPEMSLMEMDLTVRTFSVLTRAGITKLSDLRAQTQESLVAAGVGPKALDEIQRWLCKMNVSMLR